MDDLALLPLFKDLRGHKVLLAGDFGPGLIWKTELMLATGALVSVFLATGAPEQGTFGELPDQARLMITHRPASEADFEGVVFAVGDFADQAAAEAFATLARQAGVLVNLVDKPTLSDVQFGAIVNRSPIVIAIATDGKAPSLGRAIRGQLEALLPAGLANWARGASQWRGQSAELAPPAKRAFWAAYADLALKSGDIPPDAEQIAPLLEATATPRGHLVFLDQGAQEGKPCRADQITIEALGYLQRADLIVHAVKADLDVLTYARREAAKLVIDTDVPVAGSPQMTAISDLLKQGGCVIVLRNPATPQWNTLPDGWATLVREFEAEAITLTPGNRKVH